MGYRYTQGAVMSLNPTQSVAQLVYTYCNQR